MGRPRRGLTLKQERFAQAVAEGNSYAQSYRIAYAAENMSDSSIRGAACMLMQNSRITERIELLNKRKEKRIAASGLSDRELVLDKLRDIAQCTDGGPAVNSQLRALELLGKTIGLFKDVQEVRDDTRDPDEIRSELLSRLDRALAESQESDVTH